MCRLRLRLVFLSILALHVIMVIVDVRVYPSISFPSFNPINCQGVATVPKIRMFTADSVFVVPLDSIIWPHDKRNLYLIQMYLTSEAYCHAMLPSVRVLAESRYGPADSI